MTNFEEVLNNLRDNDMSFNRLRGGMLNFTVEEKKIIIEALAGNTTLIEIDINFWGMGNEVAAYVAAIPTLKELNLSMNNIDDNGAEILSTNSGITTLTLIGCNIGDKGAEALSTMPALEELDLSWNRPLNYKGIQALAKSKTLLKLNLEPQSLDEETVKTFLENTKIIELKYHKGDITPELIEALNQHISDNRGRVEQQYEEAKKDLLSTTYSFFGSTCNVHTSKKSEHLKP